MTTKGSTMIINVYKYKVYTQETQNSQLSAARQSSFRHNLVIEPRVVDLMRRHNISSERFITYII